MESNVAINVADIVEENGKTVRENNMALPHRIPEGTLVEVKHQEWHGGGACSKIHARLFVVHHGRDCDGTPLYWLSKIKKDAWTPIGLITNGIRWTPHIAQKIYYDVIGGFPETSLTVIEVTPDIISGKDSLQWNE